jgi:hypothetical protein
MPRPPVLAVLACAVMLAAGLAAQVSAPAAGTILGRVVEAGSDRGLAGALVRLSADSLMSAPAPTPAGVRNAQLPTALTDASGTSLFRDVAPGSYVVTAFAPGFFPAAFGQRDPEGTVRTLRVRGDRPPPEISIDAWRHGVIAGTICPPAKRIFSGHSSIIRCPRAG